MNNRQVILSSRPVGVAQAEHFKVIERPLPVVREGELLVRNHYLSVDPAMRGWIADSDNYASQVEIGTVMRSLAAAEIIESKHPDYKSGQFVTGWFGWQEFAAIPPADIMRVVSETDLPLSLSLGILGINGMTAYLALTLIGDPKPKETVLVSTAAGAVGSAVGQIASIMGCRTVGIAGGAVKCELCLEEFGYDVAIDYKENNLAQLIRSACPDGIDVYFDNTGGIISDAVYPFLARNARIIVCGTASISNWNPWPIGPRIERYLLVKRARMQGFVIFDHHDAYQHSVDQLASWVRTGKLRYREDILDGIDACPDALAGLYRGDNKGKRLVRLTTA